MQNHDTEKLVTLVLAWVGQRFLAIFVGLLSSRQFKFRQFRKKKFRSFSFHRVKGIFCHRTSCNLSMNHSIPPAATKTETRSL